MALDDVDTKFSPSWWFRRLSKELTDKRDRFNSLESRQRGNSPMPHVDGPSFSSYENVRRLAQTNYEELIVAALRERLLITGFRTAVANDELGDSRAAEIWKRNMMDVTFVNVMDKFLALGETYVSIDTPDEDDDTKTPVISAEDPRYCIVEYDAARPTKALAALKLFHDDVNEEDVAFVWTPGEWHKFTKSGNTADGLSFRMNPRYWTEVDSGTYTDKKLVPVVRFLNKDGMGEFEPYLRHINRINYVLLQRLVIATLQAFRQRAAKGLPQKDANGNAIDYREIFKMDPGAMWLLPTTAEMWESGTTDITPLLTSVRDDVRDLAAVSRTPLTYLSPDAANSSAEGANLQREGSTYKAEDRMMRSGSSWARVMACAFTLAGDSDRADEFTIKTVWRPIERYSLTERSQAFATAVGAGMPFKTAMIDIMQYAPDDVLKMDIERMRDQLMAPAANGAATAINTQRPTPQDSNAEGGDKPAPKPGAPAPKPGGVKPNDSTGAPAK